jgi:O-acetyl-ADP-ribose deacetylase (regulator of RNase III)
MIFQAAGEFKMSRACAALGGCPPGESRVTDAFDLPADYVIHAVGPNCSVAEENANREELLRSAYLSVYDLEEATIVAMDTMRTWLNDEHASRGIDHIYFTAWNEDEESVYMRLFAEYFPGANVRGRTGPRPHSRQPLVGAAGRRQREQRERAVIRRARRGGCRPGGLRGGEASDGLLRNLRLRPRRPVLAEKPCDYSHLDYALIAIFAVAAMDRRTFSTSRLLNWLVLFHPLLSANPHCPFGRLSVWKAMLALVSRRIVTYRRGRWTIVQMSVFASLFVSGPCRALKSARIEVVSERVAIGRTAASARAAAAPDLQTRTVRCLPTRSIAGVSSRR